MDKTLPSGATLHVGPAPFEDAIALHDGVLEAFKGFQIPGNVQDLMDLDMSDVKDAVISAATSKAVRAGIFACARRCTYNNRGITQDLFDDPKTGQQAREDYYAMAWEIIQANCGPFFVKTFSWLKALLPTTAPSPESK